MPNTLTFEGLEVAPEDEEKVRKYIRTLIKGRVVEGKTSFNTTETTGFNAIVVEEVVSLLGIDAQLYLTSLFSGHRTVSEEWLEQIAMKTGKPYNRPERIATCEADYKMDTYKADNHIQVTETLIVYHPDKPKLKQGTVLASLIKAAKKRGIPILNVYPIIHNQYVNSEYPGVRKRKGCQTWYYRIKKKLPNGEEVIIEKGGFQTDYEAHLARVEALKELTVKEQIVGNDLNMTFEDVFNEFIAELSITKSDALVKKYKSIYNSQLREVCGLQLIAGITNQAIKDYAHNLEYFIFKKGKKQYSQSYVNAIKKLLNLVFDYAYNKGYITTHPMFGLPITWPKPYKG